MKCEHEVQIFLTIVKSDERAKLGVSSGIMMICFYYRHGLPRACLRTATPSVKPGAYRHFLALRIKQK